MQELHNSPAKKKPSDEQQAQAQDAVEKLYAKPKRTVGLRLFDIGLYPILSNFAVFAVSVVFTFLTERGGDRRMNGDHVYGGVGKFFHARGEWLETKFQGLGFSKKSANMGKIVFFSFADGTLMAPLVKLLEDRREKIAYWIDEKLGTVPEDKTPYQAEPKQSWWSVIGGRAATALIVVPVAVLLSKKVAYRPIHNAKPELDPDVLTNPYKLVFGDARFEKNTSLNDIAFNDTSVQFANKRQGLRSWVNRQIERLTGVSHNEGILHQEVENGQLKSVYRPHGEAAFTSLAKMTFFEAFYTSVCTAGLYVSSRFIATFMGNRSSKKAEKNAPAEEANVAQVAPKTASGEAPRKDALAAGPKPHVASESIVAERLNAPETALEHA